MTPPGTTYGPDLLSLSRTLTDKLDILEPGDRVIIHNASVIDGLGNEPAAGQAVIVDGGTITRVAPERDIAPSDREGARAVDAAGCTLMPGLIDMHFHFSGHPPHDEHQRYLEANDDVRALRAARDALSLLNAGFTTVRSLGHGTPDTVTALKTALAEGVLVGPTIRHSGWALSQSGGHGVLPYWPLELVEERRPRSAFCDGVEACRVAVRRNFGRGAECTKVYATQGRINSPDAGMHVPNFSLEELTVICQETHRLRGHVAAHATGAEGARTAVAAGVDTLEHGPCDLDLAAEEVVVLMSGRGTVLVPTMTVFAIAAETGQFSAYVQERARRWYNAKQEIVRLARRFDVPIGLGTDFSVAPNAGQNARELELLVDAGLSPLEALASGTSVAATAIGLGSRLGAVAVGRLADLLLVNGNPAESVRILRDAGNIRRIFKARVSWSLDFGPA